MKIFNEKVRHYGITGRGISARENVVIKTTKAIHLLSATAWAGGSFSMQALSYLRLSGGLDEVTQAHVAFALRFIDTWVVMPGLAGCILTGLFYSLFGSSPPLQPSGARCSGLLQAICSLNTQSSGALTRSSCSFAPVFCRKASGRQCCRP